MGAYCLPPRAAVITRAEEHKACSRGSVRGRQAFCPCISRPGFHLVPGPHLSHRPLWPGGEVLTGQGSHCLPPQDRPGLPLLHFYHLPLTFIPCLNSSPSGAPDTRTWVLLSPQTCWEPRRNQCGARSTYSSLPHGTHSRGDCGQ